MSEHLSSRARDRENADPEESDRPIPKPVFVLLASLFLWGLYYLASQVGYSLAGGDSRTPAAAVAATSGGASIYAANCAACHQASGQGLPGVFPPLAGSEWVLAEAPVPVAILLYGLHGDIEVAGTAYQGVMPAFGQLSDSEIAAVVSYIRGSWDNDAGEVSAEEVGQVRRTYGADHPPWEGGEGLHAEFGAF
jgi:mono/diheme cytochrome c family protein